MKKHNQYETLFRKNKNTDRVIIDIALGDYMEFFNEWDNSAYKMRDIHSDLVRFLDLCSDYIPLRKKIEIVFSIETSKADKEREDSIRLSYSNYYNALKRLESRKVNRYIRMSMILLIISLVLLTSYGFFYEIQVETIGSLVLLESLLIGGWVFAWEAVHTLFIDIIEPVRRMREIQRFIEADITFVYPGSNNKETV